MRRISALLMGACLIGAGLVIGGAQRGGQGAGPVLTRVESSRKDWDLRYELWLLGMPMGKANNRGVSQTKNVTFLRAEMMFPVIESSATHDAVRGAFRGGVFVGERMLDVKGRMARNRYGDTSVAVWEVPQTSSKQVGLVADLRTTCYEVRIDEKRAARIGWPTEGYSPEASAWLARQEFVEPDHENVQKLVQAWTGGKSKQAKPYQLAKLLAAKVLEHVAMQGAITGQPSEHWRRMGGRGKRTFQGAWLAEPGDTARSGKGSPLDVVNLLCSVYRAAGLPARVVIAEDNAETRRSGMPTIHAWVEFCLGDEGHGVEEWIPVDIIHQREFSSRAPGIDQKWQYFGQSEETDDMVPFAHHWIAPGGMRAEIGPAGMWGWVVAPEDPEVRPELFIASMEAVKRGGQDRDQTLKPRGRSNPGGRGQ